MARLCRAVPRGPGYGGDHSWRNVLNSVNAGSRQTLPGRRPGSVFLASCNFRSRLVIRAGFVRNNCAGDDEPIHSIRGTWGAAFGNLHRMLMNNRAPGERRNGGRANNSLARGRRLRTVLLAGLVGAAATGFPAWAGPDQGLGAHRTANRLQFAMAIEPASGETTAAAEKSDAKPKGATAEGPAAKDELIAGGIHAQLKPIQPGTTYAADSAAFAEITLTNKSGAKRIGAELVLEPEVAEIHAVVGTSVKSRNVGMHRVAAIPLLPKNRPRKVVVELRLRDGGRGPGGGTHASSTTSGSRCGRSAAGSRRDPTAPR